MEATNCNATELLSQEQIDFLREYYKDGGKQLHTDDLLYLELWLVLDDASIVANLTWQELDFMKQRIILIQKKHQWSSARQTFLEVYEVVREYPMSAECLAAVQNRIAWYASIGIRSVPVNSSPFTFLRSGAKALEQFNQHWEWEKKKRASLKAKEYRDAAPERKKQILKLHSEGAKPKDIAKLVGVSYANILNIINKERDRVEAAKEQQERQIRLAQIDEKLKPIKDEYQTKLDALNEWYAAEKRQIFGEAIPIAETNEHTIHSSSEPIEFLDLSVRVYNSLKRTGVTTVDEVIELYERAGSAGLYQIRNFGRGSYLELMDKLILKGYLTVKTDQRDTNVRDE